MTFVAVGFGVSVAFAQTTPTQEDQSTIQTEQSTEIQDAQQDQDRRLVEMSELPLSVQESFTNGDYSEWQVLAIYEKSSETGEGSVYEFELAQAGEAYGETEDGLEGVETERVSERQPDLILALDENGEILEEKNPDEDGLEK